jgi:aspartate/methionine/tyrosine aminotransferase
VARYLHADVQFFAREAGSGFAVARDSVAAAMSSRTRLIVLSNLHNPSGALVPATILQELGELAGNANIHVLVDEVYLDMLFDHGAPFAFGIGAELGGDRNPFIVTNSLTKTYGLSGLRCGWILAAPELAHRIWRLNDLFGVNAAHIAEQMSVNAFDRLETLRQRARALLMANRRLLDQFLDAHPELQTFRPPAGTVVFPELPNGDPDAFFKLLRDKYKTSVVPGEFFGMPRHFRIGIGGETAMVAEGLDRLDAALSEFGSR